MTGRWIFFDFNLPNGTTWFYFSLLLAVALFFKFSRVLSVPVQYFYDELKGDDDPSGFAESEGADAIAGALQSPDGVQIARIFSETTDPDKRKLILNAVKLLADYKGP